MYLSDFDSGDYNQFNAFKKWSYIHTLENKLTHLKMLSSEKEDIWWAIQARIVSCTVCKPRPKKHNTMTLPVISRISYNHIYSTLQKIIPGL